MRCQPPRSDPAVQLDDLLLDDADRLAQADTRQLLAITASAGASMRAAAALADPAAIDRIVDDGRPHAVVVAGGGGSRAAGDILAAVAGSGSPVPVVTVSGPGLPGWIGPTDLVLAVSGSGGTPETLSVAVEAARRGCRLAAVCPPRSKLDHLIQSSRGAESLALGVPPIGGQWRARMLIWSLATPLVMIGGRLGLVNQADTAISAAARELDDVADLCSPSRDLVNNIAKRWALDVAESSPILWGTGEVGAVAVRRFGRQLAENAGLPSVVGTLPSAARTQAALLNGPRAGQAEIGDIFRDRVDDPDPSPRLRLIMLRDADEHPDTAALAAAAVKYADSRNVPTSVLQAESGHPMQRLAKLVGVTDFAAVYAGLALGSDPMSATNELDPSFWA